MKKKKNQIGFRILQKGDDDLSMPKEYPREDSTKMIAEVIGTLYLPVSDISMADELLSSIDIYEAVTKNCDATKSTIFLEMKKAGFRCQNIQNELLWLVRYKT